MGPRRAFALVCVEAKSFTLLPHFSADLFHFSHFCNSGVARISDWTPT